MKILADENIPRMTVAGLRERGHDVRDIRGTASEGFADPDLWAIVMQEERVLITTDRRAEHPEISIIRLR